MMKIPSIFIPKDWSFNFYEGPNWHPDSIFRNMRVAELGYGNGWISIALVEKWRPMKVCTSCSVYTYAISFIANVGSGEVRHLLRLLDMQLSGVCQSASWTGTEVLLLHGPVLGEESFIEEEFALAMKEFEKVCHL
jgi:hypothetical protein